MLVLERCLDSAIRIGNSIRVRVLRTGQQRVLLGIEAPKVIPVWREELAQLEGMSSDHVQAGSNAPFRVLIVEDDDDHAELIRLALSECKSTSVTVVPSGEEALRLLREGAVPPEERPHLVLLDLQLPGLSGLDVLRRIRTVPDLRPMPVVMLSCSTNEKDVRNCINAGANAYVSKAASAAQFSDSIFRIADFWSHVRRVA